MGFIGLLKNICNSQVSFPPLESVGVPGASQSTLFWIGCGFPKAPHCLLEFLTIPRTLQVKENRLLLTHVNLFWTILALKNNNFLKCYSKISTHQPFRIYNFTCFSFFNFYEKILSVTDKVEVPSHWSVYLPLQRNLVGSIWSSFLNVSRFSLNNMLIFNYFLI